jgi:hypothetical protein
LIPFTIITIALYNIFSAGKTSNKSKPIVISCLVLFFGLIHGLAFANAFESLVKTGQSQILSILEFALGLELGQFVIVFCVLFFGFLGQTIFRFSKRDWVMVLSSIILGLMIPLILSSI